MTTLNTVLCIILYYIVLYMLRGKKAEKWWLVPSSLNFCVLTF